MAITVLIRPSSSLASVSSWTSRWPTTYAGPVRPTISEDTVNYAQLYRLTRDIVEGPSCRLLEAVAARIAATVLGQTPVAAVRVRLRKPEVPIKGSILAAAAVEITRWRD